jgi:hypothetical protein
MKIDLNQPGAAAVVTADATADVASSAPSALEQAENVGATIYKKDIAAQTPEALSPEVQAYTNSTVKAAIAEVFAQLMPMFERMKQPTPKEKAEQDAIDAYMARSKREKQQGFEQDAQNRANLAKLQADCSHTDQNNRSAISLNHNFPDRLPRGICVQCRLMIAPAHYELAVPGLDNEVLTQKFLADLAKQDIKGWKPFYNKTTGRCTHFLIPEHPLYHRVREQDAKSGLQ